MSIDSPNADSNLVAPVGGVVAVDDGRIASDLACWSCEYNLRSIELDAACPECGTLVGYTLEQSHSRKARPFSLHTINPASRTVGILFGVLGPLLLVGLAASTPHQPMNADWQSGQIEEIVGVMLSGRAMWAFYPFLLWAYLAMTALMCAPVAMGRQWWVKAGLWLGCILGLQYQLIANLNFFAFDREFWTALIIGIIPLSLLASMVVTHAVNDARRKAKTCNKRSWRSASIQFGLTVGVLIGVLVVSRGLILLLILISGPYMMLLCMSAALCRLYRTDFDPPAQRSKLVPVVATVGGYAGAWPIAITQAQIVYSTLPTTDPSCYICTASARGHAWLTRAKPVRFADGRVMLVTRQMQTLKAAEQLIAARYPSLHRGMRRRYDTLGPKIARRIQFRWLADLSYVFFAPLALAASLTLRLLGGSDEIDRAYKG